MKMDVNELNVLATGVREQGLKQEASMTQLVYDPDSGEFRQITRGSQPTTGEIVTEMTENGFACSSVIYVSKDDVRNFISSSSNLTIGFSYEWEGEHVVHIALNKTRHAYGEVKAAIFVRHNSATIPEVVFGYVVTVKSENDVIVFENKGGRLMQRSFTFIPAKDELYSRNKGILEMDILENKRVMIVGLGSFGSQIAIEMAKSGVGNFSIWDFDRVELHNLARHTCMIDELGRLTHIAAVYHVTP